VVVMTWITPFHALPYWVMMRAARPARVTAVVHNATPHEKLPFQRRLTRWVLGRCDGLVAHSATVADELAELAPEVEVHVAPLPPLVQVQARPLPPREPGSDGLRVLFFGFVRPYKGVDVALEAIALLRDRGLHVSLTVAGEFWEPLEPWYARVHRLGLDDRVDVRPGYVSDAAVDELLASHHAVVMPYRSATQSGVVPLAMAAERPVVASAVGGLAEFVTEGVNGTLAEPGDASSLADAIERCALKLEPLAANTRGCLTTWEAVSDAVFKAAGLAPEVGSTPA
jgi:glycosyltransferase involved in cell wall biosynthesis